MTDTPPGPRDRFAVVVLLATLLGYPLLRASGLIPAPNSGSRVDWWTFWLIVAVGHWACFGLIALALRRSAQAWNSIGVDWTVLRRHWPWFVVGLAVLIVAAVVAPRFYYEHELPTRNALFPLQPTSAAERLFWIFGGGITAGVVEETVFRGFALTRLGKLLGSPWRALPVSAVAFVFLHGVPPNLAVAANFGVVGLVFGALFIWMKCRRLEILIILHAMINCVYVFLP